jgi:hypothetical protein
MRSGGPVVITGVESATPSVDASNGTESNQHKQNSHYDKAHQVKAGGPDNE